MIKSKPNSKEFEENYDKIFYKGETQGVIVKFIRKEYDDCKSSKEVYDLIQSKQPIQLELPLEEYPENNEDA